MNLFHPLLLLVLATTTALAVNTTWEMEYCLFAEPINFHRFPSDFYCRGFFFGFFEEPEHLPTWFTGTNVDFFIEKASEIWKAFIYFKDECWLHFDDPLGCFGMYTDIVRTKSYLLDHVIPERMRDWMNAIEPEAELVNHCFHYHKRIAPGIPFKAVEECRGISYDWEYDGYYFARIPYIRNKWSYWIAYWNNRTTALKAAGKADEATLLNCQYNNHWQGVDEVNYQKMLTEEDECGLLNHPDAITSGIPTASRTTFHKRILRLAPIFANRVKFDHLKHCLYPLHHLTMDDPSCENFTWYYNNAKEKVNYPVKCPCWKAIQKELVLKAQHRVEKIDDANDKYFPVVKFITRLQVLCALKTPYERPGYKYNCTNLEKDFPQFDVLREYYLIKLMIQEMRSRGQLYL